MRPPAWPIAGALTLACTVPSTLAAQWRPDHLTAAVVAFNASDRPLESSPGVGFVAFAPVAAAIGVMSCE